MKDLRQVVALSAGATFTLLVLASLVRAHMVLPEVGFAPSGLHRVVVCSTAPSWAWPGEEPFERTLGFWGERGFALEAEGMECGQICTLDADAPASCVRGAITIDLISGERGMDLGGISLLHHDPVAPWAAIELSPVVSPSDRALVLAHEMGHALGFDHVRGGRVLPGVDSIRFSPPIGHIMHPTVEMSGWDDEGVRP